VQQVGSIPFQPPLEYHKMIERACAFQPKTNQGGLTFLLFHNLGSCWCGRLRDLSSLSSRRSSSATRSIIFFESFSSRSCSATHRQSLGCGVLGCGVMGKPPFCIFGFPPSYSGWGSQSEQYCSSLHFRLLRHL